MRSAERMRRNATRAWCTNSGSIARARLPRWPAAAPGPRPRSRAPPRRARAWLEAHGARLDRRSGCSPREQPVAAFGLGDRARMQRRIVEEPQRPGRRPHRHRPRRTRSRLRRRARCARRFRTTPESSATSRRCPGDGATSHVVRTTSTRNAGSRRAAARRAFDIGERGVGEARKVEHRVAAGGTPIPRARAGRRSALRRPSASAPSAARRAAGAAPCPAPRERAFGRVEVEARTGACDAGRCRRECRRGREPRRALGRSQPSLSSISVAMA